MRLSRDCLRLPSISMENSNLEIDKIIRTKRKSIAIQITEKAELIIKAPYNIDDETIIKVVNKYKNWIKEKRNIILQQRLNSTSKEFINGEGFLYLGRYYKLNIRGEQKEPLIFENGFYLSKDALPIAKDVFIQWYKKVAFEKISRRAQMYSQISGLKFNKINITDAYKRWGSCSPSGNLNFSWRLIMAPLSVVDYVIVHEIVHLEEKNHKKRFWDKVKLLMPDYEKNKEWLETNGHLLRI